MPRKKKLTPAQIRKKNIRLIVKANQLVEAKYMFDIWEMRIFLSVVASISPSDDDDKVYRVWYKDIKNQFKIRSDRSYGLLRDAAIRLFEKSLVIDYMKDGHEREQRYHLIRGVDYLKASSEKEGNLKLDRSSQEYIDVRIDPDVKPYLLDIRKHFDPLKDRYTSYELRNVIHLKPYGIRIYELLKQYEKIGRRTIEVDRLKDYFNITDEYPRFTNFYQIVIKRSIMDINKKTDITVPIDEIEKIKKGRSVHALSFPIYSKSSQELATLRGESKQQRLFKLDIEDAEVIEEVQESNVNGTTADLLYSEFEDVVVKKFGVTPTVFLQNLNGGEYTKNDIEQAINVTRRAKYNKEITKNIAGFFLSALKNGYTDTKEEAKKSKKKAKAKVEELKEDLFSMRADFSKAINARIKQITSENEEVTLKAVAAIKSSPLTESLVILKEQSLDRPLELEDYRKDEKLRAMVVQNIMQMQEEQFDDIIKAYNPRIKELEKAVKMASRVGV